MLHTVVSRSLANVSSTTMVGLANGSVTTNENMSENTWHNTKIKKKQLVVWTGLNVSYLYEHENHISVVMEMVTLVMTASN